MAVITRRERTTRTTRTTAEVSRVVTPPSCRARRNASRRRATSPATSTSTTTTHTPATRNGNGLRMRVDAREERKFTMGKDALPAHVVVDGKLVQLPFEEALASRPAKAPGTYQPVTEKQADAAWKKAMDES